MAKASSKMKHKPSVLSVSSLIILSLYSLILIAVAIWAVIFSLTNFMEDIFFDNTYLVLPEKLHFENYKRVFEVMMVTVEDGAGTRDVLLPEMFLNSLLFAVGSAFFGALAPCLMGYITSKFKFKFNNFIEGIVLITIVLPIVGSLPSNIRIVYGLGLNDSISGIWIMAFGFANMYFFIFKAAFSAVPKSISEAAYIDGANHWSIFFTINLPLVKTTFFSVFTLILVSAWNNYATPLAFAPNVPTVSYGLMIFIHNTRVNEPPLQMAGALLLLIPILTVFAFTNQLLMGNLSIGGVKE